MHGGKAPPSRGGLSSYSQLRRRPLDLSRGSAACTAGRLRLLGSGLFYFTLRGSAAGLSTSLAAPPLAQRECSAFSGRPVLVTLRGSAAVLSTSLAAPPDAPREGSACSGRPVLLTLRGSAAVLSSFLAAPPLAPREGSAFSEAACSSYSQGLRHRPLDLLPRLRRLHRGKAPPSRKRPVLLYSQGLRRRPLDLLLRLRRLHRGKGPPSRGGLFYLLSGAPPPSSRPSPAAPPLAPREGSAFSEAAVKSPPRMQSI